MEVNYSRAARQRRGAGRAFFLFLLITALIGVAAWFGYKELTTIKPNNTQVKPAYKAEIPVIVNGKEAEYGAIMEGGVVKLALPLLEQLLEEDKPIHYEPQSNTLVFTTVDKVLRLKTDALTGYINQSPYTLQIAAEVVDDLVYIPETLLSELFGMSIHYEEASGIVTLMQGGDVVQRALVVPEEGAAIRTGSSIEEPYLFVAAQGEAVRLWEETDGWYLVQNEEGHTGYMEKRDVRLGEIEQVPNSPEQPPFIPWKVWGSKINMTWEAVYSRRTDTTQIGDMPGVNVVSPTWFEMTDSEGTIASKADPVYVKWAHDRGYQVWALFSNGFEPEQTTIALSSVETRFNMIQQLLAYAEVYHLQGINIDFENVYTKDKENLVQFVKEMTPLLHEQGLVVSIDVTPKSNSEMWSVFLDRPALGRVVDYMMVMAYDEHWASSPKAGSVSSLPWAEHSIKRILEEDNVPAGKLVLSMPLYTRIWTEKPDDNGAMKVSSKAVGMEAVKKLIADKALTPVFDEAAGQNYVEYTEDGALQRIWIEDDVSMAARVELVRKYNLAGVATWARTFQTPTIWPTIDDGLNKRP